MKYIFSLLTLLFLQISSFKEIKPKLCINCKYFITDNDNRFGKCSLFIKDNSNSNYELVNGIRQDEDIEYHYCSTSRGIADMCGIEGKMYKKNSKKYTKRYSI
uniref:Uncharacterized protein n=1 Tax=viral metagenome TaxID=1070528 RepID=A0A6C0ICT3_9ZZZZ